MSSHAEHSIERDEIDACPRCGSRAISRRDRDWEGKRYYDFLQCDACGQEFTEVYQYSHTYYMDE